MFAWFSVNWLHQLTRLSQTAVGGLLTIVSLATELIAKSRAELSWAELNCGNANVEGIHCYPEGFKRSM